MAYEEALEAAGAKVIAIGWFGSYQGDWIAKVEYNDTTGYVHGYFGSCSYCDGFEAEFGYGLDGQHCESHWDEDERASCDDCKRLNADYQERLVRFGQSYLEDIVSYDEICAYFRPNLEWDMDAHGIMKWLESIESGHSLEGE